MNGYLKAMQCIANLPEDAHASGGEVSNLTQWIRSMNQLRENDRRTEKSPGSVNVVTLRLDRTPSEPACPAHNPVEVSRNTIDAAVSFVLNVLFDGNRSKAEIRIARAMFRPSASIVLIPRDRPSLACAVGIDEFFATEKTMLKYEDSWEETWRVHDPSSDTTDRFRICAHILLDPKLETMKPRSTEVVFVLRNSFSAQRIHSCTIVYDEAPLASSPITMFA